MKTYTEYGVVREGMLAATFDELTAEHRNISGGFPTYVETLEQLYQDADRVPATDKPITVNVIKTTLTVEVIESRVVI